MRPSERDQEAAADGEAEQQAEEQEHASISLKCPGCPTLSSTRRVVLPSKTSKGYGSENEKNVTIVIIMQKPSSMNQAPTPS